MKLFNLFRKPAVQPAPEPRTQECAAPLRRGPDGVFRAQARSLAEFENGSMDVVEQRVADLSKQLDLFTQAQQSDNAAGDLDPRRGHIVLEQERIEYHVDTGVLSAGNNKTLVQQSEEGTRVEGPSPILGQDVLTVAPDQTTAHGSIQTNKRAERGQPVASPSRLVENHVFMLSPEGEVLPESTTAQSLSEADSKRIRRKRASRAEEIVASAVLWDRQARLLDGVPEDRNPEPGAVVLPCVEMTELKEVSAGHDVLDGNVGTFHEYIDGRYYRREVPLESVKLESSDAGFLVCDHALGGETRFQGAVNDSSITATLKTETRLGEERVILDRTNGTLTYQTYHTYNY